MADVPAESHFHFDFLAPFSDHELSRVDNWFLQAGRAYVLLREGAFPAALEAKFPPLIELGARSNFGSVENFRNWKAEGNTFEIFLQPLLDIHLRSEGLGAQIEPNGDIAEVWIFGAIAFVVLLAAVFNFINLTTSRSLQRANEVGVRKTLGSTRSLLVRQFLTESLLVSYAALGLSFVPVLLLIPGLNAMIGRSLSIAGFSLWPVLPSIVLRRRTGRPGGGSLSRLSPGLFPALAGPSRPDRSVPPLPAPQRPGRFPVRPVHSLVRRNLRRRRPAPLYPDQRPRFRQGPAVGRRGSARPLRPLRGVQGRTSEKPGDRLPSPARPIFPAAPCRPRTMPTPKAARICGSISPSSPATRNS